MARTCLSLCASPLTDRKDSIRTHRKVMTDQLKLAEVRATAHPVQVASRRFYRLGPLTSWQEMECHLMIRSIIETPKLFIHHVERCAQSFSTQGQPDVGQLRRRSDAQHLVQHPR
jgi:hypothetical protein